ncbi:molybdopterin-dependent oxidoreductase [Streptomyces sp. NBC_01077]|uniref:molybdopterin-dependent oxidoreductase n=1 Tax=Streptomyces sp. NBC_01077 TaxID=2903746 RepID=UPI00386D7D0D|nr:molybdopterin-dependent oxidoreductase [Streptomyces sp. NBC_01077]
MTSSRPSRKPAPKSARKRVHEPARKPFRVPGPSRSALSVLRPPAFTGRLHDARTATAVGRWLGAAFAVCFVTGLVSHYLQHPPAWLADDLPARPVWGYWLTQGLHIATGLAAIVLLLVKLWTVYPRLFVRPPVRSVRHALERLSVAVLVAAAVFELLTGLLNIVEWYPWPFSFIQVHFAVAWVVTGSILLHVAVKTPEITAHWSKRSTGTLALPAEDAVDRRSLLLGMGAAVGVVTLTTVGQTVTPLKTFDLLAPRHPDHGPQGLPVNRTAAAAGVTAGGLAEWRLEVAGPRPYALTLDGLRAMEQARARLPIACVEGWTVQADWGGVPVRALVERAGGRPGRVALRVTSLEVSGAYRVMEMGEEYVDDPLTLLALTLNGRPLSLDHGFPARVIAPNRPGVLQTKWVHRLEVL